MNFSSLRTLVVVSLIAIVVGIMPTAHAADVNARIKGTVSDPTGAVIPGATVTATNTATGVKFSVNSGKDGSYIFAQLPIGTYNILVNATGFKSF